ncbi:MFS transporter, DHA1 family, bicyclomycin/chloramphenicol resistance protein [Sporobacter termitidis DSM 10068]|uniref:Bcr/CflA family efflux transporter n=1 Tax=Sporobacter termitidis DSM 10068 TaxID=1123282 RepID=A0A1M5YGE4_9FIRM|nr:Bcr/CflA family efflux MFS transporter [Sporobacter termitidis]SHI10964.1 MFS transporter, DHA1 family, bicyclomycin/chloramphenicol resistance protein [Sporobacter termitidis DSM 10068]
MNQVSGETAVVQKYLGGKGLIVYLVLLSAFVPMSTDLYLPALPTMTKYFDVPEVLTNLTIILFFVFYSAATLVWGPLSDKHGRRPVLLVGLIGYAAASLLCALAPNVYMLIAARILQAIGAAAASATATAVVKDVYEGQTLEKRIAAIQSISVIVPVVAPMLGALLLKITDWRGAFYVQAILGAIIVLMTFLFTETIQERSTGGIFTTMGRLFVVLRNKRFTALLLIFSLIGATFMAYISASSYIYQDFFGLSGQVYSYFFSFNAAMMFVGPILYIRLSSHFSRFALVNLSFIVTAAAGVLLSTVGQLNPWLFALTLLPTTIMGSFIAPPSRFLMLSQQTGDTGSASSLINAVGSIAGSVGMTVTSLNFGNLVVVIGVLNVVMGLVCGAAWLFFTSRPLLRDLRG